MHIINNDQIQKVNSSTNASTASKIQKQINYSQMTTNNSSSSNNLSGSARRGKFKIELKELKSAEERNTKKQHEEFLEKWIIMCQSTKILDRMLSV